MAGQALEKGFRFVESSPLVRSSYQAEKHAGPTEDRNNKIYVKNSNFQDLRSVEYKKAWEYQEKLFDQIIWQRNLQNRLNDSKGVSRSSAFLRTSPCLYAWKKRYRK
jgi:hypothetical protein